MCIKCDVLPKVPNDEDEAESVLVSELNVCKFLNRLNFGTTHNKISGTKTVPFVCKTQYLLGHHFGATYQKGTVFPYKIVPFLSSKVPFFKMVPQGQCFSTLLFFECTRRCRNIINVRLVKSSHTPQSHTAP